MKAGRLFSVGFVCVLLATASAAAGATPLAGPCAPGMTYDPACDVDHNGTIDVTDIQLTAGHWGQTGSYNIHPAMVPKTGQTTSYVAGDDGDLERGVVWPNPRFTDNSNGTVTDNLTGLIWLKNADCFSIQTWPNALIAANTLASGSCGLTDGSAAGAWRLPNVREMQSLIDYGRLSPALPSGHPFTGAQNDRYWASTTFAANPSPAWRVLLYDGRVDYDIKTGTYFVWPVRGGQ